MCATRRLVSQRYDLLTYQHVGGGRIAYMAFHDKAVIVSVSTRPTRLGLLDLPLCVGNQQNITYESREW